MGGRIEPYPNCIAAKWEGNPSPDLARLVSYATETELRANLYNFGDKPATVTLRVMRLDAGEYAMTFGPDLNDDGVINGADLATMLGAWGACP